MTGPLRERHAAPRMRAKPAPLRAQLSRSLLIPRIPTLRASRLSASSEFPPKHLLMAALCRIQNRDFIRSLRTADAGAMIH